MSFSGLRGQETIRDAVPVLSTKLKPRVPDDSWVERRRLIVRLEQGAAKRLTLISAPAGFGKSCLASQWLHSGLRKFAWLSLDEHDDNLDTFVRCVLAALRSQVPGFGSEVEDALGMRLPPPRNLADILGRCLESLDEPLWLVLDDFHKASSSEVDAFVARLLTILPESLRLVMLTRQEPKWFRQRWVVQDWVIKLGSRDLNFSLQETQAFFRRSGTPLDEQAAKVLHRHLEGWVAGLQLAQLSGLTGGARLDRRLQSATEQGRIFSNFLVEEVVSQQSPEVQNFLAVTSLFDRFCPALCDALLEKPGEELYSSQTIKYLQDANLFLVSLDSEGVWFRYHHLFRDVLRSLPHLRPSPEQLTSVYSKAGSWFSREKLIPEGLQSYIAAGEIDTAVAFLEEHLHSIIEADISRRELKRYLELFPARAESAYPGLLVAHAWCDVMALDTKKVVQRLDHAEMLLGSPSVQIPKARRKGLRSDIASLRSFSCYWQGDIKAAVSFAARTLRSTSWERHYARDMAGFYAVLGATLSGRKKAALEIVSNEMRADLDHGRRGLGMHLLGRLSIEMYGGNYNALEQAGREMEHATKTSPIPHFFLAYGIYFQGRAALERNDLDTAVKYFSQMEDLRYQAQDRLYLDSLEGLALVAAAAADFQTAREVASCARDWADEVRDAQLLLVSDSFDARLAMLSKGDPRVQRGGLPSNAGVQPWLESPYLTQLECSIADATQRQCAKVLPAIDDALRNVQQFHNTPLIVQFLAVKAIALWGAGRQKDGLRVLRQALRLGEPRGFLRSFVDRAPLILELLQALLEENPDDAYLQKLVNAHARGPGGAGTAAQLNYWSGLEVFRKTSAGGVALLSNREVDVLLKLAGRLSNKEIAQCLFISDETVKKHTVSIYRKLGVHTRREAVLAAQKMGLLASSESPKA